MTREEMIALQRDGVSPVPTSMALPAVPSSVAPLAPENAHRGAPKPFDPDSFNRLPISETEYLHQFKDTDGLHVTDMVAKEHARGSVLKSLKQKVGDKIFKSIYQQLKFKSK